MRYPAMALMRSLTGPGWVMEPSPLTEAWRCRPIFELVFPCVATVLGCAAFVAKAVSSAVRTTIAHG